MTILSRALGAAAWGYAGTFLKFALQFGVQSILARALGPEAFGIFAVGVVVVSFAMFFGDVASSALILQAEVRAEEVRFAFTWQILVSSLAALVIYFIAPTIATLSVGENAVFAIRVLSLICIFTAFGGVSCSLLRKNLSFKKIQFCQISGYVVGYAFVGLPYGLLYQSNENALVFAWVAQAIVTSSLYYCFARHSLKPLFFCKTGLALVRFSVTSFWAISVHGRLVTSTEWWSLTDFRQRFSGIMQTPPTSWFHL